MNIQTNIPLKLHTTFRIGGPAKWFCEISDLKELKEALEWLNSQSNKPPIFILGGGSNVLFSDKGFFGLVLKINNQELKKNEKRIICGAGINLAKLVNFSVKNNLTGLEWAAGIPGTVGGAVRGNAGAFGGEISSLVDKVEIINIASVDQKEKGKKINQSKLSVGLRCFNRADCKFCYRGSVFKRKPGSIIWLVVFNLKRGNTAESQRYLQEVRGLRKDKHPQLSEFPSAGSVFKNPIVENTAIRKMFEKEKHLKCRQKQVPAGWLIEKCGLKGKQIGGARVSEKQANFIVNTGKATAEDVIILMSIIKQKVRQRFNVQLQEEVEVVY